ncbi:MAG: hypothetical protein JO301_11335 [Chitinophagaceae bacterium]|nr:hypothetical protein [Chitinophagaceae bacterium]
MKSRSTAIIVFLLITLFAYTAFIKLLDYNEYVSGLQSQPLPDWLVRLLIPLTPLVEFTCAILLSFQVTRTVGLAVGLTLLVLFTSYTVMVLLHVFPHVPCPCGGIIRHLSWKQHLAFNLFFLFLNGIALWRRRKTKHIHA